jgi:8-oxo-dGTP pyrophosphatase MutT (NUDIX family)
MQATG